MSKVIKNDDKKQIWLLKNTKWVWLYLWIEDLWCRRACACACASKCLRCTMLCCAVLYCTVWCGAVPCHSMLCQCAMLCCVEWRYGGMHACWMTCVISFKIKQMELVYIMHCIYDLQSKWHLIYRRWCHCTEIFWRRSGHIESEQRSQL